MIPVEVKSSAVKNHESIDQFEEKYSGQIGDRYLLSQKDVGKVGTLKLKPIYIWHLFCTRISKSNERPALRKTQSRVLFFMCNFNYTVNDNWV